jgi:hypothetical protein
VLIAVFRRLGDLSTARAARYLWEGRHGIAHGMDESVPMKNFVDSMGYVIY